MNVEGHYEWVPEFLCRGANLPGLTCFATFSELWASPPTPHTNRGSVRPRRLDTAHSATNGKDGAMPLAPAAYEDLREGRLSCLGANATTRTWIKTLSKGLYTFLYLTGVSPERAVRGALQESFGTRVGLMSEGR